MLLQSLVDTIELLKERLTKHEALLRSNEIRARMALIDPMLAALGWDPADPSQVVPEFEIVGSRADYALLDAKGEPVALLEAKKFGESLAGHLNQMLTYGNRSATPYAGLTDGDHWELYSVFEQKPIDDRRILNVSIARDPVDKIALEMLVLWRRHMSSGKIKPVRNPILAEPQPFYSPSGVDKPARAQPGGPPSNPPGASGWTRLVDLDVATRTLPPKTLKMPDGKKYSLKTWKNILLSTIEWLYENGSINETNMQFQVTKGQYLINNIAQHPTGKNFRGTHQIAGIHLYVETNLSAKGIVKYTKAALQHFGQAPEDVYLSRE